MIALTIILVISIAYAVIRGFHDSKISGGKWKTWAFIEGVLVDLVVVALTILWFRFPWWQVIPLALVFAFTFWLVFDCLTGYLRTGFILYIGNTGFDLKMRKTFLYNKPLFGWQETGAFLLVFFKCFWLALLIPSYIALLNLHP